MTMFEIAKSCIGLANNSSKDELLEQTKGICEKLTKNMELWAKNDAEVEKDLTISLAEVWIMAMTIQWKMDDPDVADKIDLEIEKMFKD